MLATAVTTFTKAAAPPSTGNRGSLLGQPPPLFNGDRTQSKPFMFKFKGWALVNFDKEVF